MSPTIDRPETEVADALDRLAASPAMQSNCMFQLALMLARIAAEPCADGYKDETALALMDLIRAKPKSNVVRLFGSSVGAGASAGGPAADRSTVVHLAAR